MNLNLPYNAKKYLLESLSDDNDAKKKSDGDYPDPRYTVATMPQTGVGAPPGRQRDKSNKGETDHSASETLFGTTDKDDDWGLKTAAGMYTAGKVLGAGSDIFGAFGPQILGDVAGKYLSGGKFGENLMKGFAGSGIFSAIPGAVAKTMKQGSDILGASWFDANIGRIGQSAMELAAQGAGHPWVPLAVPADTSVKVGTYDPDYQLKKQVSRGELERQKYRLQRQRFLNP